MNRLIDIENLSYGVSDFVLQQKLNLSISDRQLVLVSGANGSGKSTLLKVLIDQMPFRSGAMYWHIDINKVGYIPQGQSTKIHLPLTLRDILLSSTLEPNSLSRALDLQLLSTEQLDRVWNNATGGEKKRTLLTRLLLQDPQLLLLDEPMNQVDSSSQRIIWDSLYKFLRNSSPSTPRAILMVCNQESSFHELENTFSGNEIQITRMVLGESESKDGYDRTSFAV